MPNFFCPICKWISNILTIHPRGHIATWSICAISVTDGRRWNPPGMLIASIYGAVSSGLPGNYEHLDITRGFAVRNNWRIGLNRLNYDDIQEAAIKLSEDANGADIVIGAFLVDRGKSPLAPRFNLMPASHLHPTMIMAVEEDGRVIEEVITEVSREPSNGNVYDLEIDNLHNYIANGVVVHNSIYRWRGADWRNVQRFEQDFPDAQVILLEQNYRSRQTILEAAMGVINRAPNRRRKQLFSERGAGERDLLL